MKKQFVVIGLGRFGLSVTKTLIEHGNDVLAIDKDEQKVQEISTNATYAVQVDATDELALKQLDIHKYTHAIVAIGEDLQASILTTLLLKEMEVGEITAKAKDELHGKVLAKIGADHVIFPERDMGKRVGNLLSSKNLIDYIELSSEYNMEEIRVPNGMKGCELGALNIHRKYGCTVIAIKDRKENVNISPGPHVILEDGDVVVVIGKHREIQKLQADY